MPASVLGAFAKTSRDLEKLIDQYKNIGDTIMTDTETAMDYLLWLDVETTGLDLEANSLLEIELRLTDMAGKLRKRFHDIITPPESVRFDRSALKMHAANSLIPRACAASTTMWHSAALLRDWLTDTMDELDAVKDTWHPAGSSVHFDIAWLKRNGVDISRYEPVSRQRLDLTSIRILLNAIDTSLWHDITDGIPQTDHRTSSCLDRDIATYKQLLDIAYNHPLVASKNKDTQ
jgi:oligoribonuclease